MKTITIILCAIIGVIGVTYAVPYGVKHTQPTIKVTYVNPWEHSGSWEHDYEGSWEHSDEDWHYDESNENHSNNAPKHQKPYNHDKEKKHETEDKVHKTYTPHNDEPEHTNDKDYKPQAKEIAIKKVEIQAVENSAGAAVELKNIAIAEEAIAITEAAVTKEDVKEKVHEVDHTIWDSVHGTVQSVSTNVNINVREPNVDTTIIANPQPAPVTEILAELQEPKNVDQPEPQNDPSIQS